MIPLLIVCICFAAGILGRSGFTSPPGGLAFVMVFYFVLGALAAMARKDAQVNRLDREADKRAERLRDCRELVDHLRAQLRAERKGARHP